MKWYYWVLIGLGILTIIYAVTRKSKSVVASTNTNYQSSEVFNPYDIKKLDV